MKTPQLSSAILGVGLAVFCAQADSARAAEIKVWTARAIATVLAEVGPEFERQTGHRLSVTTDLSPAFVSRANAGESFDVLITGSVPLAGLAKDGQIIADTRTHIARSGIGVGVRTGAPRPDIRSVEAFRRALLKARSIAYLKDVGSGIHIARVLERLGIADAIKEKVIRPGSDIVSELVAKGEAEIGMVVITQILTTPGVELVGPLPPAIQSYVAFDAGVGANSNEPAAARALIRFLGSAEATRVITAQGMEFGISVPAGSSATGNSGGTICLAPVAAPNDADKSLGNPTGGNPVPDYAVQLDDRRPVQLGVFTQPPPKSTAKWIWSHPTGILLSDVSVDARHTIVLRRSGKPIESFRFRLASTEPDQCLFLNEFYLTWQMWPRAKAPWCKCAPVAPR